MALTAITRLVLLTPMAAIAIYGQRAPFTWSPTGAMETPRHSACVVRLPDGRVLISGGVSTNETVARAEMYSKEGGWFRAASMNQPRAMHTCSVLLDGRVLVTGGAVDGSAAEIYDPPLDTWMPLEQAGIARWSHTASALGDGRILLAGGANGEGPLNALEIFDLASGSIVSTGVSLIAARERHTATVLSDGRVLLAGGFGTNGAALRSTEIYDPGVGTISPGPDMSSPRAEHSATALADERVLIAGGWNGTEAVSSAELFLPDGSFQPTASLAAARRRHLALLIEGHGGVVIAGGAGPGGPLASTEVYLPWEDRFEPAGPLLAPRERLAGVMLDDGIAVAIGGLNSNGVQAGCGIFPTPRISVAATVTVGQQARVSGSGFPIAVLFSLRRGSTQINDRLLVPGLATDSFGDFPTTAFMNTLAQDIGPTFTLRAASGTNGFAEKSFTIRNTTTTAFDNGQLPPPPDLGGFPTVFQSAPFTVGVRVTASGTTPNINGTVRVLDGTTVIGSATVSGTATLATATVSCSGLATLGTHSIHAEYLGDATYASSSSLNRSVSVVDRIPDIALSTTPSDPRMLEQFQVVCFVSRGHDMPDNAPQPTGTVTLRKAGTVVGTATLSSTSGSSSASFPFLLQTQEPFTSYNCAYGGDTVYNAASLDRSITVGPARTTLTFTTVPGTYTFGQAVTIAVQLNYPSSLFLPDNMRQARLGFVSGFGQTFSPFFVTGDTISLTPAAGGPATGSTSIVLPFGLTDFAANFAGGGDFSSALGLTTTRMNRITTTATLTATPTNGTNPVTLTATITPSGSSPTPSGINPRGSVEFFDGTTSLGSVQIPNPTSFQQNQPGIATLTVTRPTGNRVFRAVYAGDTNFNGSNTANVSVTIP